jgi:outer membrane lipoprotein carrier protein
MKICFSSFLLAFFLTSIAQTDNPANDAEASGLLKKVSEKYKAYKNISANFTLYIQQPKVNPNDDDRKFVDTMKGQVILQDTKFKVAMKGQQIYCDGKDLWTWNQADKEVQLNVFEESDDVFSPAKIFTLYKQGYLYQIKEKKTAGKKSLVVIEMAPPNKKLSYFKIDITIDEATLQLIESKVYEKNGVRYIYKLTKQTPDQKLEEDTFTFDPKKHPGVKVVDLR